MTNWNLKSADNQVALNIVEDDSTGAMSGNLTAYGIQYAVTGGWSASGSLPGRNASAFSFSGSDQKQAPTWVSATGIMVGPGARPQSIELQFDVAASSGAMSSYAVELLGTAP